MRRYTWLIAVLIVAMGAVMFVAGCGKKQQSSSVVSTGSGKAADTASPVAAPAGPANNIQDLLKKSTELKSYVMTMDMGQMKMRTAMKMDGGKPVAMKMDTGAQGTMLMQIDKKMMYMINPATKTAMAMPLNESQIQQSQKDPMEALKTMVNAKVSSETVDGIDCLKVVNNGTTVWCNKENGLPVQMEATGKIMKFKYEQINSVPDSEFELPAGIKIQQMPAAPTKP